MAFAGVVKETTGYQIGSIRPFHGHREGYGSCPEAWLREEEVWGVGAGQWGQEIMISPANLVKASRAIVVNLTDRSKPVLVDD